LLLSGPASCLFSGYRFDCYAVFDLRRVSDQMDGWYGFGTHAADYKRCAIIPSQKIGVKQLERTDPILRIGSISFLRNNFFKYNFLFIFQNILQVKQQIFMELKKNPHTKISFRRTNQYLIKHSVKIIIIKYVPIK